MAGQMKTYLAFQSFYFQGRKFGVCNLVDEFTFDIRRQVY